MRELLGCLVTGTMLLGSLACSSPNENTGTGAGGAAASGGAGSGASSNTGGVTTGGTLGSGGVGTGGVGTGGLATGGAVGTGGAAPTSGGAPGSGGAPLATGGSGGAVTSDAFTVELHLATEESASAPGTIAIATWSMADQTPTAASIEFGPTTDYGMTAPVDLSEPDFRTVLVGMKSMTEYHVRIVATVAGQQLMSEDLTITSGPGPAMGTASITQFDVVDDAAREPGFIVTSYWQGQQAGMVFILDQDGEIVWWHDSGMTGGVAKAAISDDGKDMWMITASNQGEKLRRVRMDTLEEQTYDAIGSHDIQPISGGLMLFIDYGEPDNCNSAFEIDKAGVTKEVFDLTDQANKGACHGNAIAYNKSKDTYQMGQVDSDVFLFPRGGATSTNVVTLTSKVGDASTWGGTNHGMQLLNDNHILLFANREGGNMGPSTAIEYNLDDGSEVWRWEGGQFSANLGDVQRLPGGNTLVTYSNAGVIHEVTPDKKKVLEITAAKNLGYATWRPSLYGTSPDIVE